LIVLLYATCIKIIHLLKKIHADTLVGKDTAGEKVQTPDSLQSKTSLEKMLIDTLKSYKSITLTL
jgi:hypothetical protein